MFDRDPRGPRHYSAAYQYPSPHQTIRMLPFFFLSLLSYMYMYMYIHILLSYFIFEILFCLCTVLSYNNRFRGPPNV